MKSISQLFVALLAAAAVPAAIFMLFLFVVRDINWAVFTAIAFAIALLHALILGLPAFTALRRRGYTQWWLAVVGGFIVGLLPTTILVILTSLNQSPGSSSGGSAGMDVVNGVTTPLGWFHAFGGACIAGVFGVSGGLAFWAVWRYLPVPLNFRWKSKKTLMAAVGAAVLLPCLFFFSPRYPELDENDAFFIRNRAAAEKSDGQAAWNISTTYHLQYLAKGKGQARVEAERWGHIAAEIWKKSAERGDGRAQLSLGDLYATYEAETGVKQDWAEAYFWFSLAKLNGEGLANTSAKNAADHLTPEQIAVVDTRVKEWKPVADKKSP